MPYFDLPRRAYAKKLYMVSALSHFGGLELPLPPRPPDWTAAQEQKLLARMRELVRSQPGCGLAPAARSPNPEGLGNAERLAGLEQGMRELVRSQPGCGLAPAARSPNPEGLGSVERMRELVRSQPGCGLGLAARSPGREGLGSEERLARLGPGLPPVTSDPIPQRSTERLAEDAGPVPPTHAAPCLENAEAKAALQDQAGLRMSSVLLTAGSDAEMSGRDATAMAGHPGGDPDGAEGSAARARAGAVPVRSAARAGKQAGRRGSRQGGGRFALVAAAAAESVRRRQRGESAGAGGEGAAAAAPKEATEDAMRRRKHGEEADADFGSIPEAAAAVEGVPGRHHAETGGSGG